MVGELERELQTLKDLEEIRRLHREYVFSLNGRDLPQILGAFTEDAVVEVPGWGSRKGSRAIEEMFAEELGKLRATQAKHLCVQPVISVRGESAEGHWVMDRFADGQAPDGTPAIVYTPGRCDCTYVKIGGTWRIGRFTWRCPWPEH